MNHNDLYQILELPADVVEQLNKYETERTFRLPTELQKRLLSRTDWDEAVKELQGLLEEDTHGFKLLYEMLDLVCTYSYPKYKEIGISDEIFVATMKFITRFLEWHKTYHGEYKFIQGPWFPREMSCIEFRVGALEYEFIDSLCDWYIQEYLDLVAGFENVRDPKSEFIITRISRSLKEVVRNISDEMKQSDFEPTHCELKIGKDGEIPAVHFPFDSGDIILTGSIDRVDQYNGYVRIIDYKTGSKSFKLPDILFGLNMQMLIYLYCVVRGENPSELKPAGILYKTAKRDTTDKGMTMNGLLPNDI